MSEPSRLRREQVDKMEKDLNDEIRIIKEERNKRLIEIFSGEVLPDDVENRSGEILIKKKTKLTRACCRNSVRRS